MQHDKPLVFWSKKCNGAQTLYPANRLELLSIVLLLREFRSLLLGQELHLFTDHLNLTYATFHDVHMMRWRLEVMEFGPAFHYVPGQNNVVADALSRLPMNDDPPTELEERDSDGTMQTCAAMDTDDDNLFSFDMHTVAQEQENDSNLENDCKCELGGVQLWVDRHSKKVLVPESLRNKLLTTYHEWLIHPGASTMKATINQVFTWAKLDRDVTKFVEACLPCSKAKHPTVRYGKLPVKKAIAWPCSEAAFLLDRHWLNRYPRPVKCIYDGGSEFKKEFLELLDSYGIEHAPKTVRNPQANAVIERVHRVIGDKMRTKTLKTADEWEQFLNNTTFALRAAYHSMTNTSPAQQAFGRNMFFDMKHETDWVEEHRRKADQIKRNNERENSKRVNWTILQETRFYSVATLVSKGRHCRFSTAPTRS
ncbi:Integrase core domain [Phytophthora infestans]|uniref:Integrase core domain n=1 Tax=Phytophthora infestans TaxID=4787 RepID=A0A8S9TLM6_PHYIN|nr:Integrase core domain [Phytophthora infestans]